jgi:hypothetical protein
MKLFDGSLSSPNARMIMYSEFRWMWKDMVVTCLMQATIIYQYVLEGAEETTKIVYQDSRFSLQRLEPKTS